MRRIPARATGQEKTQRKYELVVGGDKLCACMTHHDPDAALA